MSPPKKDVDLSTYRGRCAARLQLLRERCGLSVEEVAKACGVNARNIYNWEQARTEPKQDVLPLLATVFGLRSPRSVLSEK